MEHNLTIIIILTVLVVFFVPFYPFRMVKKLILLLLNTKYVPLPIKFDDIGGVPVFGMKLYGVTIQLGTLGTLKAEEIHLRLQFWRILTFRRPSINPLLIFRPNITVKMTRAKGDIWFLLPLTVMKKVVSILFSNLTGLNKIRIYDGTITIIGPKGETDISELNAEFSSHGQIMKVRSLNCHIGDGKIEILYPKGMPSDEGRVIVRNLHLEKLVALKLPKYLSGPIHIEGTMRGNLADTTISGNIRSNCLYFRDVPLMDLHSPLSLEGNTLKLTSLNARIGEYALRGSLTTNIETDQSLFIIKGGGSGTAAQLVLQILAMKPFISSAGLDADIRLEGDLNIFDAFTGDIRLKLKNVAIDYSQIGEGTMTSFPLKIIPEGELNLLLEKGTLYFNNCSARAGSLTLNADGRIEMTYNELADKVLRSVYFLDFTATCDNVEDLIRLFSVDFIKAQGQASADFQFRADYEIDPEMSEELIGAFNTLDGTGTLTVENGLIHGLSIGKFLSLDDILEVTFDRLQTGLLLTTDTIGVQGLTLTGRAANVSLDGSLAFRSKEVRAAGDIKMVSHSFENGLLCRIFPPLRRMMSHAGVHIEISGTTSKLHSRIRPFGFNIPQFIPALGKGKTDDSQHD